MIQIEFSEAEIETLRYERFNHPHPKVQKKMETLFLKSQNLPHSLIEQIAGISSTTLWRYLHEYIEGGIERLKVLNFYQPKSELMDYKTSIEEYFKENPPASILEAMSIIERITGIKRSPTQIRHFLKRIGMKRLKTGMIPAKADPDEQEEFLKEKLEPRIEEAKLGKRKLYFMDAAHFILMPYLGYLWCFIRQFIKAPAGRKRYNVLGALDAITLKVITVVNDAYINAESVCELLIKISKENIGLPITIVLDNARYQKCLIVKELSEALNIELLYLPSYSPNLNIIERLWKFVKKQCLYSKYYDNFDKLKKAISDCISETHGKHKKELKTLLNLHFQKFKKEQILSN